MKYQTLFSGKKLHTICHLLNLLESTKFLEGNDIMKISPVNVMKDRKEVIS